MAATALTLVVCACGVKKEEAKTNMLHRALGNTGIEVGEIGIGCEAFSKMDTAQSRVYMDVAIDSGINYIDIYDANPTVRSNIGYALKGRRDKMVIQGHIGSYWNGTQYERTRDVEKCKKGFSDLLSLLGTDHIEVGMMHIVDDMDDWNAILGSPYLDYVKQLKAEGKIKHIGVSSHNAAVALAAAKSGLVEVIMFSLNPAFDRVQTGANVWDSNTYKHLNPGIDPVRVELYDYCAAHHIAITVMKVFGGGGRLLSAESSPLGFALTPSQCLAYALAKPCVAVALCGTENVEQLKEDLHYLTASEKEKDYNSALNSHPAPAPAASPEATTKNASAAATSAKATANTKKSNCTYCGHCSPCPAHINIAKVNQLLDKAQQSKTVPASVKAEYMALEHHAGECVGCGACESRCPFGVPVRERMQEAVKVFGK